MLGINQWNSYKGGDEKLAKYLRRMLNARYNTQEEAMKAIIDADAYFRRRTGASSESHDIGWWVTDAEGVFLCQ